MSENPSDLADILLQAMQLERDGHAFYLAAADQTGSAAGQAMFLTLARDELQHLHLLDEAYRSKLSQGVWPGADGLPQQARRKRLVFPLPEEAAGVVHAHTGEMEALQRGIEAEEASIALYQQALESAGDPDARALCRFLVEQEEGHRTILQGEYDYLNRSGFWFDIREFDLEAPG